MKGFFAMGARLVFRANVDRISASERLVCLRFMATGANRSNLLNLTALFCTGDSDPTVSSATKMLLVMLFLPSVSSSFWLLLFVTICKSFPNDLWKLKRDISLEP